VLALGSAQNREKSLMKKQLIPIGVILIMAVPICVGQLSVYKRTKSGVNPALISDLEKSITQAYKDKQAEAFKRYLAGDFTAVDEHGIKGADAEVAQMAKTDVRDNVFADMKVAFPAADTAVITYKVTTQATSAGQDTSGTYNAATIWVKYDDKTWLAVFHTFVKAQ
jgi:ketosteroid isomerase-like protein